MSTAAHPRLPSAAEIQKSIRERMPGLTVYNPSSDWLHLQVFGLDYYAPPDLNGAVEPHPVTGAPTVCNGRLQIRSRFLTQKDSSGKIIEGQDAPSIVQYLIAQENYGQLGLVWVPGESPDEDARIVASAKKKFQEYQVSKDEMIVSRRTEFVANWRKGPRKGEPCPPPTAAETAAMDRLQAKKREAAYKYECNVPSCDTGYAVNDWDRFAAHMKAAHNITPDRAQFDGGGLISKPVEDPVTGEIPTTPASAIAAAAAVMKEEVEGNESEDTPVKRDTSKRGRK